MADVLIDAPCPPDCTEATPDEVCGVLVCGVHSPEGDVVECVESGVKLHHNDCRYQCHECALVAAVEGPNRGHWKGWA